MGAQKEEGGMGFQDFDSFNLALLAKQLWQVLIRPYSLTTIILKENYFKNSSILEAKAKNNLSYIGVALLVQSKW